MYGNSIPARTVGGDLFEYINFQQRYNIDGRIARALKIAELYLDPLPAGQPARNMVDDHVCCLENRLNHEPSTPLEYRKAKIGVGWVRSTTLIKEARPLGVDRRQFESCPETLFREMSWLGVRGAGTVGADLLEADFGTGAMFRLPVARGQ